MVVVASYLITSTHIKIKDDRNNVRFLGLYSVPRIPGPLTPSKLRERCENVFQMVPERMKNLVIVNSDLSNFNTIQECVKVADKYAENVMVIPSLLAQLTFGLECLSEFRNPPDDEIILVVTITNKFADFVILRRNQMSKLRIIDCVHFEPNQCEKMFPTFYGQWEPDSSIFVVPDSLVEMAEKMRDLFKPENCFIKPFKKWDYVLFFGGVLYADDGDGFDSRYRIENFSSGYDTVTKDRREQIEQRHILLPQRSSLPCNIYGIHGIPRPIKIFYFKEYRQIGDKLVLGKKEATNHTVQVSGSSKEIIGYVDERGIPYASPPPTVQSKEEKESSKMMLQPRNLALINNSLSATVMPSSANVPATKINFLFQEHFFAIEIFQNGVTKLLTNSIGTVWTPMYLSMAKGTVEIGETARSHHENFPKHVIYDIFKVIGKPLNEITIDPEWGFKVIDIDEIVYFQIETLSGARLFRQEMIIAAFLKIMKLQTQSFLGGIQIKNIRVSTRFNLAGPQKAIFQEAATKNDLKILSFDVIA